MIGPFDKSIWLHLGARPPRHVEYVAEFVGGVVLQVPFRSSISSELLRSERPAALQHDGRETALSLFDPDDEWLIDQSSAAMLLNRVRFVKAPATGGKVVLGAAVHDARRFLDRARHRYGKQLAAGLFAVDHRWLTSPTSRSELIRALASVEAPVVLMLGKGQDPLDSTRAVEGVVEVVKTLEDVAICRCDHGAIGALAFGAAGGSIGLSTSTRHFVPRGERTWANIDDPTPRVFIPMILDWWKGSRLASFENDPLFECQCSVCDGKSLARFQDERLRAEADAHSVACWSKLARTITEAARCEELWIATCEKAYAHLDEIEDRWGLPHPPSKQLKAWLRFAGVRAV